MPMKKSTQFSNFPKNKISQFLRPIWQNIAKNEGFLNKVQVEEFNPGNHGLVAMDDFKAGDVIMFIPRDAYFTHEDTNDSWSVKYFEENDIFNKLNSKT